MRLLLDSHVFLWAVAEPDKLSARASAALAEGRSEVFVSLASVWELTIKEATGRLRLDRSVGGAVADSAAAVLPITLAHVEATGRLPPLHGDPFDRMLVAQAIEEGLVLVTADALVQRYPVAWLW